MGEPIRGRDVDLIGANLHNDAGPARWLRGRSVFAGEARSTVAGVYEAQDVFLALDSAPGRQYLTGHQTPGRDMARSTGILVPQRAVVLGRSYDFLTKAWGGADRVSRDRYGHWAVLEINGLRASCELAVIAWHPDPGPEALRGDDKGHPLVKRYLTGREWFGDTAAYHRARGREIALLSDIQLPKDVEKPWSIHRVLEKNDMWTYWNHIDVVAGTPGLDRVDETSHHIGSDHPANRVGVNITRRKK